LFERDGFGLAGSPQWCPAGVRVRTVTDPNFHQRFGIRQEWILKFADDAKIFGKISTDRATVRLQEVIRLGRRMADDVY